jgi:amino acid adenylation domain-containing protein
MILPQTDSQVIQHSGAGELLHDAFVRNATSNPDRVAISTRCRNVTYGELLGVSVRFSEELNSALSGGSAVAVVMSKGWTQIAGVLSVLMSGRPFVPLDPSWPDERLEQLIRQSGACGVVCNNEQLGRLTRLSTHPVVGFREGLIQSISGAQNITLDLPQEPHSLAYIIFTSGSTGTPKGVLMSHSAVLNTICAINDLFSVNNEDSILALSALTFDLGIYDIFGALSVGATIVLPDEADRMNPRSWIEMVHEHGVTIWNSVPSLMDLALDVGEPRMSEYLRSLRLCMLSGDWLPVKLPLSLWKANPDCAIVSLGGATECAIWSIYHIVRPSDCAKSSIPYGISLPGQRVFLSDRNDAVCEAAQEGQICISGHGLAIGYLGDDDLTNRTFIQDASSSSRVYLTGDYGRLDAEGRIEFLGRKDQQIKISGYRVELYEIETALLQSPGITSAAVVAFGERHNRSLGAIYVGEIEPDEVKLHLQSELPNYMIPNQLVKVDNIPLSSTGKIDRKSVKDIFLQRTDVALNSNGARVEVDILKTAQDVLGMEVTLEQNLLDIGATSIDVLRMINAIESKYSVRPKIEDFYSKPNVSFLLAYTIKHTTRLTNASPRAKARLIEDSIPERAPVTLNGARQPHSVPSETSSISLPRDGRVHVDSLPTSARKFSGLSIPIGHFSEILGSLASEKRGADRCKFQYPSAGGLYPLNVSILIAGGGVDSIPNGFYCYHPETHAVSPLCQDVEFHSSLHFGVKNRPISETLGALLFFSGCLEEVAEFYGSEAERLLSLEAGYAGQLLRNKSFKLGVSSCPLHGFDFEKVKGLSRSLAKDDLIHMVAIGMPDENNREIQESVFQSVARINRVSPIGPGQERLLLAEHLDDKSSWYNSLEETKLRPLDSNLVHLKGALKVNVLEMALQELVTRHEALRTYLHLRSDGVFVQLTTADRELEVLLVDGQGWQSIEDAVGDFVNIRVVPTDRNLFRVTLVRLKDDEHLLIIHIHHLVSDGWSIGVLFRDLSTLYNSILLGSQNSLPPIGRTPSEMSANMEIFRASEVYEKQLLYWENELKGSVQPLGLPEKRNRSRSSRLQVHQFHLSKSLCSSLGAASSTSSTPGGLSGPIVTAIALVASELSGNSQVNIGCMVSGRDAAEEELNIGFYTNTAIVRVNVPPMVRIDRVVAEVNRSILGAVQHQLVPIQDVVQMLKDAGRLQNDVPPFECSVAINNMKLSSLELSEVVATDVVSEIDRKESRFVTTGVKLRFLLIADDQGYRGTISYSDLYFSESEMSELCSRFLFHLNNISGSEAK